MILAMVCCFLFYPIALLILMFGMGPKVHKCSQCMTTLGAVNTQKSP